MKNLKTILLIATLSFSQILFAQKETRDVGSFDEISLGVAADLYLTIGSKQSVVIEGDEDDIEEIVTEVRDGRLRIKSRKSWSWNWGGNDVEIYITVPKINALSVSGSGDIHGESVIETDDLELGVSGSGNIEVEIDSEEVKMTISGSGSAQLGGTTSDFSVRISGSGSINAYDLKAENVAVRISGSGSARVNASDELEATISGSGNVYYEGSPDKVNSNTSGSGRVKKKG